jgi:hypothetical protein
MILHLSVHTPSHHSRKAQAMRCASRIKGWLVSMTVSKARPNTSF